MGFRQWTRRPKGAEVPHTGHAWLTDGKQVWLVYSTGFAAQFMAADAVTPEHLAFIVRQASGLVCVSITEDDAARLQLPAMVERNTATSLRAVPLA